jgi:hypothetical protein
MVPVIGQLLGCSVPEPTCDQRLLPNRRLYVLGSCYSDAKMNCWIEAI